MEVIVEVEQNDPMAIPQRSISDYARPNMGGAASSIIRRPIAANNFE